MWIKTSSPPPIKILQGKHPDLVTYYKQYIYIYIYILAFPPSCTLCDLIVHVLKTM